MSRRATARAPSSRREGTWCFRGRAATAAAPAASVHSNVRHARGSQIVAHTETLAHPTGPPGWRTERSVRVPGRGHAGRHGGDPGDLYITVRVEPHPVFQRDGDDLHVVVPLAFTRRRSAPRSRCRRSMARRVCACHPARSPASDSACASAALRRRRRAARRSRRRSPAGAAEAARRAVEGTVAGIRPDQRRRTCAGPSGPMKGPARPTT